MKHNILGFNQKSVIEFDIIRTETRKGITKIVKNKLDTEHLLILRYFIDFRGTNKMATQLINDEFYYWLKYQHVLDDLPILDFSKERIADKLKDLVHLKILKRYIHKEGGIYSYYNIDVNYEKLISDTPIGVNNDLSVKTSIPIGVNMHTPIGVNTETNNPSIKIDNSIKDINKKIKKKEIVNKSVELFESDQSIKKHIKQDTNTQSLITDIIAHYTHKTGRNVVGHQEVHKNLTKLLKTHSIDECKLVIDYIITNQWHIDNNFDTLSVIFRPTKFAEKLETAILFKSKPKPKNLRDSLHNCNSNNFDDDVEF